jgi:hypothetical protein
LLSVGDEPQTTKQVCALNAYAGVDAAEQQSRCGLTIDRVRLPAGENAKI